MQQTPVTEDLMNEHGILNRVLIIFDHFLTIPDKESHTDKIISCTKIIKEFIEEFHEIMEETYIFPHFKGKWRPLIELLIQQHRESREITRDILKQANDHDINALTETIQIFIKMYRRHSAREDTIIFRKIRKFITPEEFAKISKIMDEEEDKKFGEHAYDKILAKVIMIEQEFKL